jgi:hypothetical protein
MTDYIVCVLLQAGSSYEAYLTHFLQLMQKVVLAAGVFTVDEVILSLLRDNLGGGTEAEILVRTCIVRELLLDTHSKPLKALVSDFVAKMAGAADTSRCQTWHQQQSEHIRANKDVCVVLTFLLRVRARMCVCVCVCVRVCVACVCVCVWVARV